MDLNSFERLLSDVEAGRVVLRHDGCGSISSEPPSSRPPSVHDDLVRRGLVAFDSEGIGQVTEAGHEYLEARLADTGPGEPDFDRCLADGQDWPCDAVQTTRSNTGGLRPVDPAPHPSWPDGTPMLLGQLVAFDGSEVDEDVETIEARIVKIDVGEVTAWWQDGDDVLEAVLEPDRYRPVVGDDR